MMVIRWNCIIGLITYLNDGNGFGTNGLTTVDPKRIGIMYIVVALIMFFKGFADALMMRLQQALSVGDAHGFISSGHFQEVFSAHGTTMIFFVGDGSCLWSYESHYSLANWSKGCCLSLFKCCRFLAVCICSVILNPCFAAIGKFSATGWLAYPPLSGIRV